MVGPDGIVLGQTQGSQATFSFYNDRLVLTKRVSLRQPGVTASTYDFLVDRTGVVFLGADAHTKGSTTGARSLYRLHDDGTATFLTAGVEFAWPVR